MLVEVAYFEVNLWPNGFIPAATATTFAAQKLCSLSMNANGRLKTNAFLQHAAAAMKATALEAGKCKRPQPQAVANNYLEIYFNLLGRLKSFIFLYSSSFCFKKSSCTALLWSLATLEASCIIGYIRS